MKVCRCCIIILLKRLQWAGHVYRMQDQRIPKKIMNATFDGKRSQGRPKNRWEDAVRKDAHLLLGIRNWKLGAVDREAWKRVLREAEAQIGL